MNIHELSALGTRFQYRLAEASPVVLAVHDVAGRVIRTLVRGEEQAAGYHEVVWDGCGKGGETPASGIYFVSLDAGRQSILQRLILAK